jgi:hypothetical protein
VQGRDAPPVVDDPIWLSETDSDLLEVTEPFTDAAAEACRA